MAQNRISQQALEVLIAGPASVRSSQQAVETLVAGPANVRVSQQAIEVLVANPPATVLVSSVGLEVLLRGGVSRVSTVGLEVLWRVSAPTTISDTLVSEATSTPSLTDNELDTIVSSATLAPSIVDHELDTVLSSQELVPSMDEGGYTGETNVLISSQESAPSIDDYVISDQETFSVSQENVPSISEIINSADVLTNVVQNVQDDMTRYEALSTSQEGIPSIVDVASGTVSDVLDATSGASSDGAGGYNTSGRNIPSIVDAVKFAIVDTTPPVLRSIYASGGAVTLVYNETLDPGSVSDASAYAVTVDGSPCPVTAVSIDLNQVILTVSCTITSTSTVLVSYTAPGTNPVQDPSGNDAASFSAPPPDVDTTDAPPAPVDNPGTETGYGAKGIDLHHVRYRSGG